MPTITTYIALLRAVNLAGKNVVGMKRLRDALAAAGFGDVQTLLHSGNVICRSPLRSATTVEARLEQVFTATFGFSTDILVRSADDWRRVVAGNPFPQEAVSDPGHLVVIALKHPVGPDAVAALQAAIRGREIVRGAGQHVYAFYPDGIGRSKLTAAVIEKALGSRGTARNWNTVTKLLHLVGA